MNKRYLFLLSLLFTNSILFAQVKQELNSLSDSVNAVNALITESSKVYKSDKIKAELLASKAVQISPKGDANNTYIKAVLWLVNIYYDNGNYDAMYKFDKLLYSLNEETVDASTYAKACKAIGKNYHFIGNYHVALSYYLKGLNYFEKVKNKSEIGEFYNAIGGLYFKQKDFVKALDYYNKSLAIQQTLANYKMIGRGFLNVACVHIESKKLQSSKSELDSAKIYYSKGNFLNGVAYVYASIGDLYIAKMQTDSALQNLLKAHEIMTTIGLRYSLAEINLSISNIYLSQNNIKEAFKYIDEGIAIAVSDNQKDNLSKFYFYKSIAYEKISNIKEAMVYFKLHKAYSDSVLNQETIKKQTQIGLEYEFQQREEKKETEKQLLIKEKESKERFYKEIIGLILLLILISLGIIFLRFAIFKKANIKVQAAYENLKSKSEIIEEKSVQLQASLQERDLLLKEIHHRVKNNLQVISSLFDLQSAQISDEYTKKILLESQNRIASIALLHHQLYQQDSIAGIQLGKFINKLYAQISLVYKNKTDRIIFENKLPNLFLNLDTAIPLGLIFNELFTNTFKYAFENIESPCITILYHSTSNSSGVISFKDNGIGLPDGFDIDKSKTLGVKIIKQLSKQINGKMEYMFDNGSCFNILFNLNS